MIKIFSRSVTKGINLKQLYKDNSALIFVAEVYYEEEDDCLTERIDVNKLKDDKYYSYYNDMGKYTVEELKFYDEYIDNSCEKISNRASQKEENLMLDIERLMMSISVRKTEISNKYYYEKLGKPDFSDLDWCYEQLYYLKNEQKINDSIIC